ncbi:MAG: hypothetical protein ABIO06_02460 [Pseudolysinimonas sp.]
MGATKMDQGILTLVTAAIVLAAAAFVTWVLYTVIWRAVRRGLHEYEMQFARPVLAHALPFSRSAEIEVVPDYPPREWV